ncbi:LysR family transcriptional regulator [Citrobacter koseri]|nr:LysR family transcriptional regulator [Citrobacter koseri]
MNLTLLPDLATFVLIVDHGSFSAAARAAGVTPSAMSRSVSRLERETGSQLLHRSTRKLALSETGKMVYEHAKMMLEAARQAIDSGEAYNTFLRERLRSAYPKPSDASLFIH